MFSIPKDNEFARVVALPRRHQTGRPSIHFPDGLFPIQRRVLEQVAMTGGGFYPLPVGSGKTLISFLAPKYAKSERPLLLLPASLKRKTLKEYEYWKGRFSLPDIRVETYSRLGHAQHAEMLFEIGPDLIIADEAHRLRNMRTAVTRRVRKYIQKTHCSFIALTGTFVHKSLMDYWHLLTWALGGSAPVPLQWGKAQLWANAIDPELKFGQAPVSPGALLHMPLPGGIYCPKSKKRAARFRFVHHLKTSVGVEFGESPNVDSELKVCYERDELSQETRERMNYVRKTWCTPWGQEFSDALSLRRYINQLSCGFYYQPKKEPPAAWLKAKNEWSLFVRDFLKSHPKYDREGQVAIGCRQGRIDSKYYDRWKFFEPMHRVENEVHWIEDTKLWHSGVLGRWIRASAKRPSLLWSQHRACALKLAEMLATCAFLSSGKCEEENHRGHEVGERRPLIEQGPQYSKICPWVISPNAFRDGQNLQAYNNSLVFSPLDNAVQWQQLIGRTYRTGQAAPQVDVVIRIACQEHIDQIKQSLKQAEYIYDTTGQPQYLLETEMPLWMK